jgi:hypothetical protein
MDPMILGGGRNTRITRIVIAYIFEPAVIWASIDTWASLLLGSRRGWKTTTRETETLVHL